MFTKVERSDIVNMVMEGESIERIAEYYSSSPNEIEQLLLSMAQQMAEWNDKILQAVMEPRPIKPPAVTEAIKKSSPKHGNMNGRHTQVRKNSDVIFVSLPSELRRPCGGCNCDYCKKHPELEPSWDTLAVPTKEDGHTHVCHYPEFAGRN